MSENIRLLTFSGGQNHTRVFCNSKVTAIIMPNKPALLLKVAVPSPFRHSLDYLPPLGADPNRYQPGCRLWVPLRNRKAVGILIEVSQTLEVAAEKLKRAIGWIDEGPVLPASLMQLGSWASHYYQYPIGEVFAHILPTALRQGQSATAHQPAIWRLTLKGQLLDKQILKSARKQQQALEVLTEHANGLTLITLNSLGIPSPILKALQKKQLAETHQPTHIRQTFAAGLAEAALLLNAEQQQALDQLQQNDNAFQCFLLDGITGSGKTEIYLQWIAHLLNQNKQVLVLVPEIGLTPQTLARFKQRFHARILVLHSKLTDKERLEAWHAAYTGEAHIIIGTRSAIFIPLARPGAIIVDEEHDASFKQQSGFRYSARDLAVYRGKLEQIPVLLGSATPSLESLKNSAQGRYQLLRLLHRAGNAQLPSFKLIDIRNSELIHGFSPQVLQAIKATLEKGEQVLIFINRRGYAPSLICHHCGWIGQCTHCDAHLTLYTQPPRLLCHHCGHGQAVPKFCPHCQSSDLRGLGLGTERIEENLADYFTQHKIIRIDRDSMRNKNAFQQLLAEIHQPQPLILIGTQMLAKGHHFPLVTLVVLLEIDAGLYTSDFRGPERTAQLIIQVAGRAGRAERPGQVWLQTRTPDHPLLMNLLQEGYSAFAHNELAQRQAAHLPPFYPMALIRAEAKSSAQAHQVLQQLAQYLYDTPNAQVLGPIPALMEKKANYYRAHLLLSAEKSIDLQKLLAQAVYFLDHLPEAKKVRWWAERDPLEVT